MLTQTLPVFRGWVYEGMFGSSTISTSDSTQDFHILRYGLATFSKESSLMGLVTTWTSRSLPEVGPRYKQSGVLLMWLVSEIPISDYFMCEFCDTAAFFHLVIRLLIYLHHFFSRHRKAKLVCTYNFWQADHVNPNRLKVADDFPSTNLHIKRTIPFST